MILFILLTVNDNDNDNDNDIMTMTMAMIPDLLNINVAMNMNVHRLYMLFIMFWCYTLCKETNHGSEMDAWEHTATSLITNLAAIILFWIQCKNIN